MKRKIAIIEDESIVALDISSCLKSGGYEVAFITDQGEKALELIRNTHPDLFIIDIELKGEMDGIATAKFLKEIHGIPFVFLTAYEDTETLKKLESVGPAGYILKPFSDYQLLDLIRKFFQE